MTGRMRIAILDDYQNVATSFADWDSLDADVVVFTEPLTYNIVKRVREAAGVTSQ